MKLTALFTLLYFSEGAPIGFIWWALPSMLRTRGLEIGRSLFGGAALLIAARLGWNWILIALIVCIWVAMFAAVLIAGDASGLWP